MIEVHVGDCRELIAGLEDCSVDAVVCDPPYELGFMGKAWDSTGVAYDRELWREVLRVLKPGGHLAAFGGTRTYHRLAVAIEDAGFEVRDQLAWVYGSGFPKSLDVSKAIDKRKDWTALPRLQKAIREARTAAGISQSEAARRVGLIGPDESLGGGGFIWFETGMKTPTREQWPRLKVALGLSDDFDDCFEEAEREVIGQHRQSAGGQNMQAGIGGRGDALPPGKITAAATDAAKQWQGWGTALKPAWEPICLARKPLIGTVAQTVLAHGTGALNIDACRVGIDAADRAEMTGRSGASSSAIWGGGAHGGWEPKQGRFPANLCHDGSDEVLAGFPGETGNGYRANPSTPDVGDAVTWKLGATRGERGHNDSGSAARFFYCAKVSRAEREGSDHPTMKPVALMRWLCRLVTPPGGLILDPFAGSGSTILAAEAERFRAIGFELSPQYAAIIESRLAFARMSPGERKAKRAKAAPETRSTLL